MSRSRKHRRLREEAPRRFSFSLQEETKRGIAVILLFALAAIIFLSFFNLAGTLGIYINEALAQALGFDRIFFPVLLIIAGASILFPERRGWGGWHTLGVLFFFLSFNGMVNLIAFSNMDPTPGELMRMGGWTGEFLRSILTNIAGFWVALTIMAATFLVSLLLIFNTSLHGLMSLPRSILAGLKQLFGFFSRKEQQALPFPDAEELSTSSDVTEAIEDEMFFEEEEDIDEQPRRKAEAALPEKPLTTRGRRKANLPLDLLEHRTNKANAGDIERNKEIIRGTFEQFGIDVTMAEIAQGPTVTQYSLRPAEGVKLARIVALQNDLALALAAHPLRIEAPIPGKSLVGIEIPNQTAATVSLRELLESKAFVERTTNTFLPLGKSVSGHAWVAPLEKMPHLLVAGATGSGKSVCLNTIIVSLLFENSPDELRFIMIDPKRVELTAYEGIPHLLIPPITKVDETVNALKWTVREMERRLDVLSAFGARDIASYNAKAEEKMPRIVIVLDELADLMSASGHEVEATIVRIAQMARAVGIHLILATQRPSVDVITGTIKANFPSRIAFAVASQTDSRTILDMAGAEKLLGRGDMLYTSAELSKPVRLQGAYVSEAEVKRVVDTLKKDAPPDYNYAVVEKQKSGMSMGEGDDGGDDDELLPEAADAVIRAGKASTSYLQRRLRIGYSRAARLMDVLEDNGVIGPQDGAKPREILLDSWPPEGEEKPSTVFRAAEPEEESWQASEAPASNASEESIEEDQPSQPTF